MAVFLVFAKLVMILFQATLVNPGCPTAARHPPRKALRVLVIYPIAK
jgi:hypothetical protein